MEDKVFGFIENIKQNKIETIEIFLKTLLERYNDNNLLGNIPLEYLKIIGSPNLEHFINVGKSILPEIVYRCKITPEKNVLDLGCGCGRFAIPFTSKEFKGSYYGIDIWQDGIIWCENNLSTLNPNLKFIHLKIDNPYYFEEFKQNVRNKFDLVKFIEPSSIDAVFAISTFTHLIYEDIIEYFSELKKILKKGAIAYFTFFVIDEFFFEYRERTGKFKHVEKVGDGIYYGYKYQDFFAGYTKELLMNIFKEHNFKVLGFEPGRWAEKPGSKMYQDTFYLMKG
ncbi:MAG: class I SAM-dependent methyltransferase [Candidatus Aenigmatarchaeota archaeon]